MNGTRRQRTGSIVTFTVAAVLAIAIAVVNGNSNHFVFWGLILIAAILIVGILILLRTKVR